MNRIKFFVAAALGACALTAVAQNVPPVVTSQIANFTEYAGAPARSIDLAPLFSDPDVSNAVRLTTVLGNIDIALFGQQKPITVTNFLKYVDDGRYNQVVGSNQGTSFIHRSVPGFVIQGGGFLNVPDPATPQSLNLVAVAAYPPIQNEPGISNKRGTIAMAKSSDPNSATSQWFINLANNTGLDDPANSGGFTVFGRVVGNGMSVADAINALPRYNGAPSDPNSPFHEVPVRNYAGGTVKTDNLVLLPAIAQISPLTFSAMSSNANVTLAVSGTKLLVAGNQVGSAQITVTATDFDGGTVSQTFTVNVVAAPGRLVQLSTRMQVGTGDNALIGGFIMRGPSPKRLMIRGIGPSAGISGALADPVLELHDGGGAVIASNDNWGDAANKQDMIDSGVALASPNESGILMTVPSDPGNAFYTAIVTGANNTSGIGLVEVYDLDSGPGSTLLNISTRGQVGVDPNALFAGFFAGGTESKQILVRAIGPSLATGGVSNPLADPTLEFFNGQGTKIDENDDWMTSPQKTQIQASGLAPTNAKESAVLQTLAAGPYTAVVRGTNSGTGVGSVEVYQLP
jgi:cyclophilin family peptidyl-prolyl cis-trans isomerase